MSKAGKRTTRGTKRSKWSMSALSAVMGIEGDLSDRRGLRQAWEAIDEDTKAEIRATWANIIQDEMEDESGNAA